MNSDILDVKGAAEYLVTTENGIYARVKRHQIPFRKLGSKVYFLKSELDEYLQGLPGLRPEEIKS